MFKRKVKKTSEVLEKALKKPKDELSSIEEALLFAHEKYLETMQPDYADRIKPDFSVEREMEEE